MDLFSHTDAIVTVVHHMRKKTHKLNALARKIQKLEAKISYLKKQASSATEEKKHAGLAEKLKTRISKRDTSRKELRELAKAFLDNISRIDTHLKNIGHNLK